jgi:hypothetical protein
MQMNVLINLNHLHHDHDHGHIEVYWVQQMGARTPLVRQGSRLGIFASGLESTKAAAVAGGGRTSSDSDSDERAIQSVYREAIQIAARTACARSVTIHDIGIGNHNLSIRSICSRNIRSSASKRC